MKRIFTSVLVTVIFLPVAISQQPCADSLNIYTFKYQGRTYEIVKEMKNWADAADCAEERGGFLAHINSQEEQDSIWYQIISGAAIPDNYTTVMDGGGVAYIWIGASDIAVEGTWIWDGDNDGTGDNFWTGQGAAGAGGGSAVGGAFYNWGGKSTSTVNEPDNYGGNQDAAAIALRGWPGGSGTLGIAGEWNDILVTNVIYFIIEYDANTGMQSGQESGSLKVYPQPASGNLVIELLSGEAFIKAVKVMSVEGKLLSLSNGSIETLFNLDLKCISPGIYTLIVELSDNRVLQRRIVIK